MFKPDNIENEFFVKLGFSFSPDQLAKGKVLISEPFLGDPNFNRSVILLTEYARGEGAFGLVINKPTELYMDDIIEGFPTHTFPFHYGGPVNPENLFFIHTLGKTVDEAQEVLPGLFWSGDFDQISTIVKGGTLNDGHVKFFGGYSGWGADQLENELKERSWIICDLTVNDIMENSPEEMWRSSLRALGKKFSIMADFPEDPGLN